MTNGGNTRHAATLTRFAWLSIAAAVATILLKSGAYWLTGSVGLLSDAMESLVNLAAAVMTLLMLTIAARPPDDEHAFGHSKAEYFASGFEGALILVAALLIAYTAISRLLAPEPLEQLGIGLAVSVCASLINLWVALVLRSAAQRHNSIALEADSKHLMTDVWTSGGVVVAVVLVLITGWLWLDAAIALVVAANIVFSGYQLLHRSALGLLDTSLSTPQLALLQAVLDRYRADGVEFHLLQTRQAGNRSFLSVHILVPDSWTVRRGHTLAEQFSAELRRAVPSLVVSTHVEPSDDPLSYADMELDALGQELPDATSADI